jgi:hypothetical protein
MPGMSFTRSPSASLQRPCPIGLHRHSYGCAGGVGGRGSRRRGCRGTQTARGGQRWGPRPPPAGRSSDAPAQDRGRVDGIINDLCTNQVSNAQPHRKFVSVCLCLIEHSWLKIHCDIMPCPPPLCLMTEDRGPLSSPPTGERSLVGRA